MDSAESYHAYEEELSDWAESECDEDSEEIFGGDDPKKEESVEIESEGGGSKVPIRFLCKKSPQNRHFSRFLAIFRQILAKIGKKCLVFMLIFFNFAMIRTNIFELCLRPSYCR